MKEIMFTESAPKAIGPYSQAVATEALVYTSGQLGIDMTNGSTDTANAVTLFQHGHGIPILFFQQFIRRSQPSRARTDDDDLLHGSPRRQYNYGRG